MPPVMVSSRRWALPSPANWPVWPKPELHTPQGRSMLATGSSLPPVRLASSWRPPAAMAPWPDAVPEAPSRARTPCWANWLVKNVPACSAVVARLAWLSPERRSSEAVTPAAFSWSSPRIAVAKPAGFAARPASNATATACWFAVSTSAGGGGDTGGDTTGGEAGGEVGGDAGGGETGGGGGEATGSWASVTIASLAS